MASKETRAWVERFVHLMYVEQDVQAAFDEYVGDPYIQHNPGLPDGREEALAKLVPMFSHPDFRTDVKRVVVDDDVFVVHLHGRREPDKGGSVMDMYRFEGDRIVEHWDVIQPIPETSANPHPMF